MFLNLRSFKMPVNGQNWHAVVPHALFLGLPHVQIARSAYKLSSPISYRKVTCLLPLPIEKPHREVFETSPTIPSLVFLAMISENTVMLADPLVLNLAWFLHASIVRCNNVSDFSPQIRVG